MRLVILLVCLSALLFSCGGKGAMIKNIEAAEKVLVDEKGKFKIDETAAAQTIEAYKAYADKYPKDAATPGYLFKLADVHRGLQDFDSAIATWEKVYSNYPDFEKTPHAIFLSGFTYENDKKDIAKAKELYNKFLQKYPKHDLADDVQFSIDHLGMTPEQIIKQFDMKKAAEDSLKNPS